MRSEEMLWWEDERDGKKRKGGTESLWVPLGNEGGKHWEGRQRSQSQRLARGLRNEVFKEEREAGESVEKEQRTIGPQTLGPRSCRQRVPQRLHPISASN